MNFQTIGSVFLYKKASLPENFTVTAHTGACGTKDNSLSSIDTAAKTKSDITEFDLNFTEDGIAVLSHDEPTGNEPTLQEAFLKLKEYPTLKANVDVKTTKNLSAVPLLAQKCGVFDRIFYTGISEEFLQAVKNDSSSVPYFLNVSVKKPIFHSKKYILSLVDKVKNAGAMGINFRYVNCSKKLVKIFHQKGLLVSLWTANNASAMKQCLYCEPDNITTRNPDILKNMIKKLK